LEQYNLWLATMETFSSSKDDQVEMRGAEVDVTEGEQAYAPYMQRLVS
jgi:hypothetical protein